MNWPDRGLMEVSHAFPSSISTIGEPAAWLRRPIRPGRRGRGILDHVANIAFRDNRSCHIAKCDYDCSGERPFADGDAMRVIAKSRLRFFWESHSDRADAEKCLAVWYKIASSARWMNFASSSRPLDRRIGSEIVWCSMSATTATA